MKAIARLLGAEVSMRYEDPPLIVIRWKPGTADGDGFAIRSLLTAVGGAGTMRDLGDGWMQAEMPYTEVVDKRLVELVDLLVAIRYAHPRMVQLPLALSEEEEEELREVMGV